MALPDNAETAKTYRVIAQVIDVYNTTYGNMIIRDGDGNTLTVYGVSDAYGTRYDGMDNAPQVGDIVILEAPIKHYVNSNTGENFAELFHSYLVDKYRISAISEILSIGAALPDNAETTELYMVQGTVIDVYNTTYGNMIIEDENGNRLTVYGVWGDNGIRSDSMDNAPQVGDVVLLEAPIKHYVNANTGENFVELFQSYLVGILG